MTPVDKINWSVGIYQDALEAKLIAQDREIKCMKAYKQGFFDLGSRQEGIARCWFMMASVLWDLSAIFEDDFTERGK